MRISIISAITFAGVRCVTPPTPTRRPIRHHSPGSQANGPLRDSLTMNPFEGLKANTPRSTATTSSIGASTRPSLLRRPSGVSSSRCAVACHIRCAIQSARPPNATMNRRQPGPGDCTIAR